MSWTPATFLSASFDGPREQHGYVYRDLGLFMLMTGSPKGRRAPIWSLTHLGSGHKVCDISGKVAEAFPVATAIAQCADWSFDGIDGWRNRDPELPRKFLEAVKPFGKRVLARAGGGGNAEVARQVVMARSA